MDEFVSLALLIASVVAGIGFLGAAAIQVGVDSRPSIGDDHAR